MIEDDALLARLPDLGEDPDPRLAPALRARAAAELGVIRAAAREREALRWGGWVAGAAAAAAAAGMLLALIRPAAFAPRPKHPAPLDERIAAARAELDGMAEPAVPVAIAPGLDERLRSMDRQLRCLDAQIVEAVWEAPTGGTPCTEL